MTVPLAVHLFDAASILHGFGPWVLGGIALLVVVESGVLFPFLPGDSLLVTAAILSSSLGITPWQVAVVAVLAAIVGDAIGYLLGARVGRRLFRPHARLLTESRLDESERFFRRWGGLSLVLGRFVPVVRTFVPLAAGTARMRFAGFMTWNIVGAVAWVAVLVTAGVLLGGVPLIADHIDTVMLVVVVVSLLPLAVGALVRRRRTTGAGR
ncbi:DedA family protein [Curtobacterium luteum]|uniref:DedA family protein n=1 Tax=Curtobacterium luteum TaxID=33881 RepID=UPI0038274E1C